MSLFWRTIQPPKPEDIVQYRIGFACKNGHCQTLYKANSHLHEILGFEQVCQYCGAKSFPSVIARIQSSHFWKGMFCRGWWVRDSYADVTCEFVRFLKEDTVRLEEEIVDTLRRYASRKFQESDEDADMAYQKGLNDGTIMTAKYVLGELKEEKNA